MYKVLYGGEYIVYSDGKVFSAAKRGYLTPFYDTDGYVLVHIRGKAVLLHRLLALSFIGNPPADMLDPTVDHIDGDRKNNKLSNLRWLERGVNSSCRKNKGVGELNSRAVLKEFQVLEILRLLGQNKFTLVEIARRYGVKTHVISDIKNKRTWTYLQEKTV